LALAIVRIEGLIHSEGRMRGRFNKVDVQVGGCCLSAADENLTTSVQIYGGCSELTIGGCLNDVSRHHVSSPACVRRTQLFTRNRAEGHRCLELHSRSQAHGWTRSRHHRIPETLLCTKW